jgi:heat shock protein HslJ/membrane-bound inhibitor of C-type lysozyme
MNTRGAASFFQAMVLVLFAGGWSPAKAQDTASSLVGSSWQLVRFQGGDDKTLTPDDKSKYTIAFGADGGVSVRLDCNRGRGTWKSAGPNQEQFGPQSLTRAMCPPGSLDNQIAKNWGNVRSYVLKDGHQFLSLMADGGTYEFEPMASEKSSAPKPSPAVTSRGPFEFECMNKAGGSQEILKISYYSTKPGLALIERNKETRPAFQAPSGSGAKYEGKDVMFWEHQGEAMATWSEVELTCKPRR